MLNTILFIVMMLDPQGNMLQYQSQSQLMTAEQCMSESRQFNIDMITTALKRSGQYEKGDFMAFCVNQINEDDLNPVTADEPATPPAVVQ